MKSEKCASCLVVCSLGTVQENLEGRIARGKAHLRNVRAAAQLAEVIRQGVAQDATLEAMVEEGSEVRDEPQAAETKAQQRARLLDTAATMPTEHDSASRLIAAHLELQERDRQVAQTLGARVVEQCSGEQTDRCASPVADAALMFLLQAAQQHPNVVTKPQTPPVA